MNTKTGFVLAKTLLLTVACMLLAALIYVVIRQHTLALMCEDNLSRIYTALEMYEIERGTLPRLAFFPNDPVHDVDSLNVVLDEFGAHGSTCVCPCTHPTHRALGLTYVWNGNLNGMKLQDFDEPVWMVVEINALSRQVPPPHLGRYNVLYTDGMVKRTSAAPEGLRRK